MQMCSICREVKKTARVPCPTCRVFVCPDCWKEQREKSLDCLICRRVLPQFLVCRISRHSLAMAIFLFAFVAVVALLLHYLHYAMYSVFNTKAHFLLVGIGTLNLVREILPDTVTQFVNERDEMFAALLGVSLATMHLFTLYHADCIFTWWWWACAPVAFGAILLSWRAALFLVLSLLWTVGLQVDSVDLRQLA